MPTWYQLCEKRKRYLAFGWNFRIHLKCTLQAKSIFSELLNARSQPCMVSVLYCITSLFSNWMINCKNHKHRFLHQCPSICSGSMAPYTSTVLVISLRHLSDTLWPLTKRSHDVGIFCWGDPPRWRPPPPPLPPPTQHLAMNSNLHDVWLKAKSRDWRGDLDPRSIVCHHCPLSLIAS